MRQHPSVVTIASVIMMLLTATGAVWAQDMTGVWTRPRSSDIEIIQKGEEVTLTVELNRDPGYWRVFKGKVKGQQADLSRRVEDVIEFNPELPADVRRRLIDDYGYTFTAILRWKDPAHLELAWFQDRITFRESLGLPPGAGIDFPVIESVKPEGRPFRVDILQRAPDYCPVKGTRQLAAQVMQELDRIATHYKNASDLKWAFPYVYARVTEEVLRYADNSWFGAANDAMFDWIVNFYEFYVINLKRWEDNQTAETPWLKTFLLAQAMRSRVNASTWPQLSLEAFMLGMYAHIRSDLPRALAATHIAFHEQRYPDRATLRPPYDILNDQVFRNVVVKKLPGSGIVPSAISALPEDQAYAVMDKFYFAVSVERFRQEAWRMADVFRNDPDFRAKIKGCTPRTAITTMTLPAKPAGLTEKELEDRLRGIGVLNPPQDRMVKTTKNFLTIVDAPIKADDRFQTNLDILDITWDPSAKTMKARVTAITRRSGGVKLTVTAEFSGGGRSFTRELVLVIPAPPSDFAVVMKGENPGREGVGEAEWTYDGGPVTQAHVTFAAQ